MGRHTFFLLDTRNGERSPLASGNLSDEKKEVLMKQLRFVSECHRFYTIILFVCFKILQGLQILLISGVTVTSTSQILESFWNIWSQVSQRKKPFSDFPARGPGMYTLS